MCTAAKRLSYTITQKCLCCQKLGRQVQHIDSSSFFGYSSSTPPGRESSTTFLYFRITFTCLAVVMKPEQSQASLCHFPFSGTVVQTFYCRQQAGATLEDCVHHVWGARPISPRSLLATMDCERNRSVSSQQQKILKHPKHI